MKKPVLVLLLALAVLTAGFLLLGNPGDAAALLRGQISAGEYLQHSRPVSALANTLKWLRGGEKEGELLYVEGALLEGFTPAAGYDTANGNLRQMAELAGSGVPTYCMLIPTAYGLYQESRQGSSLQGQKRFIEDAYRTLAGKLTAIDAYTPLADAREQYIFYRTDSNPTALGGYLIYRAAATRLNLTPLTLDRFVVEYPTRDYYGDFAQRKRPADIIPDLLAVYRPTTPQRVRITHLQPQEKREYHSLTPTSAALLGEPYQLYLGGLSPWLTIESLARSGRLLVLGDRTAASYLGFFSNHYASITFAMPEELTQQQLSEVLAGEYDQILLAFSMQSFVSGPVLVPGVE